MPRNVEIKARLAGPDALARLTAQAAALATEGPLLLRQDDTFFPCANARLKLRQFASGEGELIFYRRADDAGPKTSYYLRAPVADPAALRAVLVAALGEGARVVKERTVYWVGRTRVHLDRVEALGDFIELEVVLADGESDADGEREALDLMARLGVQPGQFERGAYVDLLAAGAAA